MAKQTSSAQRGTPRHSEALENARFVAKKHLWRAAFLSFFVNLLMLTGPIYMLQIYDRVIAGRSYETLLVFSGLALVMFIAMGALDFARGALLSRSAEVFESELKKTTYDFTMDAASAGLAIGDQPMKDLRQVRSFMASPALTAVFDAPWTPFFLFVVFSMHWALGMVGLVGLIVLLIMALLNERMSRNANTKASSKSMEADKMVTSTLRNVAATDAMGMRGPLQRNWSKVSEEGSEYTLLASDTNGGMTAGTKATRMFLQSAILGTGAFLAIGGIVTPGVMIAASIIIGRALAPMEIVTGQWRNFAMSGAAYKRLKTYLGAAKLTKERTELPPPTGILDVNKAFCQPGSARKPVLKGINFHLDKGEALGIIGPSAAGKSTLARVLVGVENLNSGEVCMDGARISQWDRDLLGPYVGYLPQEVELFGGTAAQNIARFSDDATSENIIAAAEMAGAHQMILGFDEGYDTQIGEGGSHLSAGQRQRLGLARAIYGNPVLVVLDEPNSNLDADGDTALAKAVQGLKAMGTTTIIIAHRPSAIAFVDKLLLLADGEVKAFGPRDEVLQKIAPGRVASFEEAAKSKDQQIKSDDAERRA